MGCGIPYQELAAFAQGDLPTDRREAVEKHVTGCDGCRKRLAALRAVDVTLRSLPAERPSAETILAARRLLSEETRPRQESEIMTLEEVAAFLRIGPEEMRPFVTDLPAFELAGQIRVRRSKLLEWVEQRERQFSRTGTVRTIARFRPAEQWKGVAL
jgi:anti-sigma factor RsiW